MLSRRWETLCTAELGTRTRVALKSHLTVTSDSTWTRPQKTSDLTSTRGSRLMNNLYFMFLLLVSLCVFHSSFCMISGSELDVNTNVTCMRHVWITHLQYHTFDALPQYQTMASAKSSPGVLRIIMYGYNAFPQTANMQTAVCKECGKKIQDCGSTTSNTIGHLKTHPKPFSHLLTWKTLKWVISHQSSHNELCANAVNRQIAYLLLAYDVTDFGLTFHQV